ncbi:MAG: class I SAM-dependent methyltransferase [Acidimicrobiia bacterium]|nr:class I SAM-dependent methyltransferase [Acidimicrobiia bacterium]
MANEEMREYWNADGSMSWVRAADRYDAQLTPFVDDIIGAAAPAVGDAVIDIGCGTGALSRAAAGVVGPGGSVAGLDISAPFLEEARRRSAAVAQVRFAECDAQTADLAPYAAAVAISRFGVMFFDDPVAAFANIARGVVAGGRLAFACWRPAFENEWITVPMGAVVGVLGMPDLPGPGAPGPFQMGDADFVRATLQASGWADIEITPVDHQVGIGGSLDLDAAVAFLVDDGIGRRMLDGKPEDLQVQARQALREALSPHATPEGVILGAAAWLVAATRPA